MIIWWLPKAPIMIGIIVTVMFINFFQFLGKVKVLILLFTFFQFYSVVSRDNFAILLLLLLLLLNIIRSDLLADIRWSVCMSKSHRSFCVSFSWTDAGLCIYVYHLVEWSNLNFLHISQWITLPSHSCQVLYSFCANLLHSLMMVLSPSPHNLLFAILLHLIYSYFHMIGFYGVVLCCN